MNVMLQSFKRPTSDSYYLYKQVTIFVELSPNHSAGQEMFPQFITWKIALYIRKIL
jgi:hypothetical protein